MSAATYDPTSWIQLNALANAGATTCAHIRTSPPSTPTDPPALLQLPDVLDIGLGIGVDPKQTKGRRKVRLIHLRQDALGSGRNT